MSLLSLFKPVVVLPLPHASARVNDAEWLRGTLVNHERYTAQSLATKGNNVARLPPRPHPLPKIPA